ncbi:MAG: rhamnulokinase [Clostridia bacterium]|nr:rhamnulokinase [Clostridia bacterium]
MIHLAIDIGASSGRHMIGYLQGGKIVLEEIYRFPNGAKSVDGSLCWDSEELFFHIKEGLKRAKTLGKIPATVSIDTWAVDYVLLDQKDRAIGKVYSYRDERTRVSSKLVHDVIPFETLYQKTGIQFQYFNTVYQLYADKLSGKLDRAEAMLMLPDYFHFLLTGVKKQEYTNATSTGMVNARTHTWDREMMDALGLPEKLFLPLSQPGTVVGDFTDQIAREIGYRATVVLPATHDTASAVLAAPLSDKNALYLSSGTWSLLGVEEDFAYTDEKSRAFNFSNEGGLGCTFRFQKNIMGLWMIQQVRHELNDAYSFAELASLARKNPCSDRVDCNDQRFLSPASMIGEIENAVGRSMTVGELAYCIFASLAQCYDKAVKELSSMTGKAYTSLNIIGGGCNNRLLNELTARETNLKIMTGPSEATAIGNMLMQMIASGEISGIREGREIIKKSFDIEEVSFYGSL